MSTEDIEQEILSMVKESVPEPLRPKVNMDTNLLLGYLDSFGLINLLSTIEEKFQIQIDESSLDEGSLSTPESIAKMVKDLKQKK